MLSPGQRILAAVSGGPDSVAMLYLLYDLREQLELTIEVAHLQHGIRGEEAVEDARFVACLAEQLGLIFHLKEIDLPQLKIASRKGSLEEIGRLERYLFFGDTARRRQLDAVATAHTADDQAETVVMRLFRGAGRTGLRGMAPVRPFELPNGVSGNVLLIRPLLDATRKQVTEFLDQRKVIYRTDSSNADLFYLRNWIRLKLMPEVSQKFGAELPARLCAQAEVLHDEEDYLGDLTRQQFENVSDGKDLNRGAFLNINKALQRRVIRLWIERRRGHLRAVGFDHIEAALSLIAAGPPQGRLAFPGGWQLAREYESITFERDRPNVKPRCYSYQFKPGMTLAVIEAGITIDSELIDAVPAKLPNNFMEAVFDAGLLKGNLLVRNFRNGDRFRPLGMEGHKKVKDLLIANQVPLHTRTALPLLVLDDEILWIPGYGRSEFARVGSATKISLHLKAIPQPK
ncbi:MAG TPA: tRNA lysidine(34) synthetase TilS [Candidatus Binatia bacterium]